MAGYNGETWWRRLIQARMPGFRGAQPAVADTRVISVELAQDSRARTSRERCPIRLIQATVGVVAGENGFLQLRPVNDSDLIIHAIWANQGVDVIKNGNFQTAGAVAPVTLWTDDSWSRFVETDSDTVATAGIGGTNMTLQTIRAPATFFNVPDLTVPMYLIRSGEHVMIANDTVAEAIVIQALVQAVPVAEIG